MGWRPGQKSLLLPVAGEFFLLTLPFIERANRRICAGKACRKSYAPPASAGESDMRFEVRLAVIGDEPVLRALRLASLGASRFAEGL